MATTTEQKPYRGVAPAGEADRRLVPDLAGSRMLVVGAGDVGMAAAQLARSLGVSIALADRSKATARAGPIRSPGRRHLQGERSRPSRDAHGA